jgi:hypothetical protein
VAVLLFQPGANAASLPDTIQQVAGCVDVDPALVRQIASKFRTFYVNIHNADFPAGAVRGQLRAGRQFPVDLPDQLAAMMNGANEIPGPGDPDGAGLALVDMAQDRVCFALGWTEIAPPIFAHIHVGTASVAGPVVVLFFDVPELPGSPTATLPSTLAAVGGCIAGQDPALLSDIGLNPADYYANVHNLKFPPGAIRGQFRRVD